MNRAAVAFTAAFGAAVLGLATLPVSGATGTSESFVVIDGIVALAGVGVPTGVMMRLLNPDGEKRGGGNDHA